MLCNVHFHCSYDPHQLDGPDMKTKALPWHWLSAVFLLFITLSSHDTALAASDRDLVRETLYSSILQEDRPIKIHLPENYQAKGQGLPVLYVLDAEHDDHFGKVIRDAGALAATGVTPGMIIVGIENTDRLMDMNVPDFEYQGRSVDGRATEFLEFIRQELIPHIDRSYHTTDYRIVFGVSSSATFSMYAMVTRPETFDAYIASSPSFFVNVEILQDHTRRFLAGEQWRHRVLFMVLGTEDHEIRVRQTREYAAMLEQLAAPGFKWEMRVMEGLGHVPDESLAEGLEMVFRHQARH